MTKRHFCIKSELGASIDLSGIQVSETTRNSSLD